MDGNANAAVPKQICMFIILKSAANWGQTQQTI
jgi:hypothetical protein